MESLCEHRPAEAITILKRAIQMTVLTGLVLVAMAVRGIYLSWYSEDSGDKTLRYWAVIRVLGFVIQIPARFRIWQYIAWVQTTSEYRTQMIDRLLDLLHSHPWRVTQYSGAFITTWTLLTLLLTPFFGLSFPTNDTTTHPLTMIETSSNANSHRNGGGYLSPCLFRIAFLSVVLAVSHVIVVVLWLQTIYDSTLQMYNNNTHSSSSHDESSGDLDSSGSDRSSFIVDETLLRSVTTLYRVEEEEDNNEADGTEKEEVTNGDNNNNKKCNTESRRDCAICLGAFETGEWLLQIKHCSHRFHKECIEHWLRTRARCPLCNYLVIVTDVPLPSPILLPLSTAASAVPIALNLSHHHNTHTNSTNTNSTNNGSSKKSGGGVTPGSSRSKKKRTPRLFSPFLMDTDDDESDQQTIQGSVSSPLSTPKMNRWTSWPVLDMSSAPNSPANPVGYDLESPRPSLNFTWSETIPSVSPLSTKVERNEMVAQSQSSKKNNISKNTIPSVDSMNIKNGTKHSNNDSSIKNDSISNGNSTLLSAANVADIHHSHHSEFRGSRLRRRRRNNGRRRELPRRDSLTSLANVWDFMHL